MSCLKSLTKEEEEMFLQLYTIENFKSWLNKRTNGKTPCYITLKLFKASCFVKALETVTNVIKDDFINAEED